TVANYRTSFTGLGKNDGIDSFLVADYVRAGRIEIDPWHGSQYLALRRLTRQRRHISEAVAREKNYVLYNVFLKFSEFALLSGEDSPVSNKFSATAETILTEFKTTEDIANAPLEELIDFISAIKEFFPTNILRFYNIFFQCSRCQVGILESTYYISQNMHLLANTEHPYQI